MSSRNGGLTALNLSRCRPLSEKNTAPGENKTIANKTKPNQKTQNNNNKSPRMHSIQF